MEDIAISSVIAPPSDKGVENPNTTVGVEGLNPQGGDAVESPKVQALGVTGSIIAAEPLQSVPENHFSAWDFESSISGDDFLGIRERYAIPEGISDRKSVV